MFFLVGYAMFYSLFLYYLLIDYVIGMINLTDLIKFDLINSSRLRSIHCYRKAASG